MLGRDIGDQFLNQNGLSYTGTSEKSDFSTLLIRTQKIDNLDTGFQHLCLSRLFFKCRRLSVNWMIFFYFRWFFFIDRISEYIEHTSQCLFADRHRNRGSCRNRFHASHQSIGRSHRDTANGIVTQML